MAQKLETGPLQIQHGHTETQVFVGFTRMCENLLLTPAQAEAFIAAMQNSLAQLAAYKAGKKPLPNG